MKIFIAYQSIILTRTNFLPTFNLILFAETNFFDGKKRTRQTETPQILNSIHRTKYLLRLHLSRKSLFRMEKLNLGKWCFILGLLSKSFCSKLEKVLKNLWKMIFILPKKLLPFSKYSIFCTSLFPSSFPCQPLLYLKKLIEDNPRVYDVIMCINWNLKFPPPLNIEILLRKSFYSQSLLFIIEAWKWQSIIFLLSLYPPARLGTPTSLLIYVQFIYHWAARQIRRLWRRHEHQTKFREFIYEEILAYPSTSLFVW